MPEAATLCPYCGVGCGLLVEVREGRVARVRGDPAHPSSLGDLCGIGMQLGAGRRVHQEVMHALEDQSSVARAVHVLGHGQRRAHG